MHFLSLNGLCIAVTVHSFKFSLVLHSPLPFAVFTQFIKNDLILSTGFCELSFKINERSHCVICRSCLTLLLFNFPINLFGSQECEIRYFCHRNRFYEDFTNYVSRFLYRTVRFGL
jgi:hypothetical protein